ncbi:Na(+)-translocating NADH-quinone reductase subunit C [Gilvimarinus agarilyticus]|uniref:Na(+)-translocating NADH-quinone reductase subunit C n=1 Tax=unclassified Gilvimarinus TaxID=2642066 RepID=UPI001C092C16|nr:MULTISPECIES: Na(+)-translocating NADH-quinone reductase subunit C [unclassified Gilvimarinus]MBU2885140.1 Na(+)-translocating NADH-quinone reductase subunit C [Gilvimarinus agarilyticus]MDO6570038.1 Na(+)-translocating NADH-quinone reductase subunit C [Gilvimarinus sp. 2_MG-2023]MDO6747305.1 Na(+)-translocating NADH-quinone reductase subunit C [Gilvimarinus sp. 1_MG-2023]
MASNDSIKKTLIVTILLCIVCSVVVSTAAVLLRPVQEKNKSLDFKRNILAAAGLADEASSQGVEVVFSDRVKTRAVNFDKGTFTDEVAVAEYDQRKASKDPARSEDLTADQDLAKIGSRENIGLVYMIEGDSGLETLVLPIRGYGLWSTLYGFMALDSDLNTVVGLGFYEHGETPGLGGEVDNPAWKALWEGKEVYGDDGDAQLNVIKGMVDANTPNAEHKVDGLSGATLTSRGVGNLVQFWLGENGYKTFLANLKKGEA